MRRLRSIDWKFPMLMSGMILATAVLFGWAAYAQFAGNLYETAGERLRTAALLISNMVGDVTPRTTAQITAIATNPDVMDFLETGARREKAMQALASRRVAGDTSGRLLQLLDREGAERAAVSAGKIETMPRWAAEQISRGAIGEDPVVFSPMMASRGVPAYQVIAPVMSFRDSEKTTVGYVVETRLVVGRGKQAIEDLVGEGTAFIVGTPGGDWTDLTAMVSAPPPVARAGEPLVFNESARGAGIGVLQPVRGTPWFVWVQQQQKVVVAPVRQFVRDVIPFAAAISLLGALLVWLFSRRIARRIVALTNEVDRLEADEGVLVPAVRDGADELERLDRAFERMASRLKRQRELESQLHQSQKLEAVGRLAGGIAHDFNNILTVVRNYGDMVLEDLPPKGQLASDMNALLHATGRATGLTRQLLAFSRHQPIEPRVLDLNDAIRTSETLLRRVIPSNVELVTNFDEALGNIMADPGHIEQVMLNLTINAVDAMTSGGRITVRTQNVDVDDTFSSGNTSEMSLRELGRHASIVFTDSGSGMDRETCSKIFDPFFTTKPLGKGTGLGLATVHGIVTQNKGRIWVYSELGRGTTFKIYFPIVDAKAEIEEVHPYVSAASNGNGKGATILVAEDDDAARQVIWRLLTKHGYSVVEVSNGSQALKVVESRGDIDLVLSDIMMPEMNGSELSDRVAALRPELPVVLMSGYAESDVRSGHLAGTRPFIDKPFTAAALLAQIRNNLPVASATH